MKLLIIDDFRLLTDSLTFFLESQPDRIEVFVTADIRQFIMQQPACRPDTVLLVIRSHAVNRSHGQEMDELASEYLESHLVVYSDQPVSLAKKYLQKGAKGYLSQQATVDELVLCLRTVQKNKRFVETEVLAQLMNTDRRQKETTLQERLASLSALERQVAYQLMRGKSGKAIAAEIGRRSRNVSDIKERILKKLNVGSSAMLRQLTQNDDKVFVPEQKQ